MSVDYFNCAVCDDIICDCGDYDTCNACEEYLCVNCGDKAREKYGEEHGGDFGNLKACQLCKKDVISDLEVLNHVLAKTCLKRVDIESEIRETNS